MSETTTPQDSQEQEQQPQVPQEATPPEDIVEEKPAESPKKKSIFNNISNFSKSPVLRKRLEAFGLAIVICLMFSVVTLRLKDVAKKTSNDVIKQDQVLEQDFSLEPVAKSAPQEVVEVSKQDLIFTLLVSNAKSLQKVEKDLNNLKQLTESIYFIVTGPLECSNIDTVRSFSPQSSDKGEVTPENIP